MFLISTVREVENNGFTWIDIVKPNRDEVEKLAYRFPFHQLNLEDCLSKIQIPKIDRYEDHAFVIAKKFILITSSAEKYGDSFYPTLTVANSL